MPWGSKRLGPPGISGNQCHTHSCSYASTVNAVLLEASSEAYCFSCLRDNRHSFAMCIESSGLRVGRKLHILYNVMHICCITLQKNLWARETPTNCLLHVPNRGPGPQPRHVPWLGIHLATFPSMGRHSIRWPHQPGPLFRKLLEKANFLERGGLN